MAAGDANESGVAASSHTHAKGNPPSSPQTTPPVESLAPVDDVPLTPEQERVLQKAIQGLNIFFTGCPGTGKSLLLRRIIHHLRVEKGLTGAELVITAPTGLSATNIDGCTIHSWSGIGPHDGLNLQDTLRRLLGQRRYECMNSLRQGPSNSIFGGPAEDIDSLPPSPTMQRWVQCKVLIIDEISMLNAALFDKLEDMARFMRCNDCPFGGIQLIVTGDFLQLPPIWNRTLDQHPPLFAFESEKWEHCFQHSIVLHKIHRQRDRAFIRVLSDLRFGRKSSRVDAFIDSHRRRPDYPQGAGPTRLCATRDAVDEVNSIALSMLNPTDPPWERLAEDSYDFGRKDPFMAPKKLQLKIGARVMLVRNLVPNVLVNGSLGKVIGFDTTANVYKSGHAKIGTPSALTDLIAPGAIRYAYQYDTQELEGWLKNTDTWPLVRFRYGSSTTKTIDILCVQLKFRAPEIETSHYRVQVPLTLAYALTVHKAQGQTFDRVQIDVKGMRQEGHIYAAISRAANPEYLQIGNWQWDNYRVKANPRAVEWYNALVAAQEV